MKVLLLLFALTLTLSASPAYAACPTPADPNLGPGAAGLCEIEDMAGNVISVIVYLGFMATLVLIVFAGIKYLTSGGEPKAVQAAHYMLTWAILGVVFMAVAWLILQLVAGFTGIETLKIFNIKTLCGDLLKFCK